MESGTGKAIWIVVALILVVILITWVPSWRGDRPEMGTTVRSQVVSAADAQLAQDFGELPLSFEANQGQTDGQVRFLSRGQGYTLFLTDTEAVLSLKRSSSRADLPSPGHRSWAANVLKSQIQNPASPSPREAMRDVLRLQLAGVNTNAKVVGVDLLPGRSNYFHGRDQKQWGTNVPQYAKVRYENLYPGIDLVYYGNQGRIEHDFVVAPGADPRAISLKVDAAEKIDIDSAGDLVLRSTNGEVRLRKPVVYQVKPSAISNPQSQIEERKPADGSFVLAANNRVTFEIGPYDRSLPLIIDPVLIYSTYFGGSDGDGAIHMKVDRFGNTYLVGSTFSPDFPTTSAAYDRLCGTDGSCLFGDAFVTKLNPEGTEIVYSTYLGGSDEDVGSKIAVDPEGNAYISGVTISSDFPTTPNAPQPYFGGKPEGCVLWETGICGDVFVAKISANGSELVYSTYLGGAGGDHPGGIAVDGSGQAYVTGYTNSQDFPLFRAYQGTCLGCCVGCAPASEGDWLITDAFVTKVNATGTAWVYSTYLGGSYSDDSEGMAVDSSGNAYVAGSSCSPDFPVVNAIQPLYPGGCAATMEKFSPEGDLVYSTYFDAAWGAAIVLDRFGNIYVTGGTSCTLPTTPGAFQAACSGSDFDAFVAKFNPNGSKLLYCTYLGGNGNEWGQAIAVDHSGNAYITGKTNSTDFPTVRPLQTNIAGETRTGPDSFDAFVTMLNHPGSNLFFSTYLGGEKQDWGFGIGVDLKGDIYVAGGTRSTGFPTRNAMQGSNIGGGSAFVAKIAPFGYGPQKTLWLDSR